MWFPSYKDLFHKNVKTCNLMHVITSNKGLLAKEDPERKNLQWMTNVPFSIKLHHVE